MFSGILQQLPAQSAGNENGTDLALQGDLRPSLPGGLHSDIPHLADPDAAGTDGLHQQGKALLPLGPGVGEQAVVLLTGQFPAVLPDQAVLSFRNFMRHASRPKTWNRPLIAARMELMVTGAQLRASRYSFHSAASSLVTGLPSSRFANARMRRRWFSTVPALRSSWRRWAVYAASRSLLIPNPVIL